MPQIDRAKTPDPPDLPDELDSIDATVLGSGEPVTAVRLENLELESRKLIGVRLIESEMSRVTLRDGDLSSAILRDVELSDCDFAGLRAEAGEWRRVRFSGGRLTGLTAPETKFFHLEIRSTRCDYVAFRYCEMKCVRFVDCDLSEADFHGSKLEDVTFENCRMRASVFTDARLERVDFSSSDIDDAVIGAKDLPGAIVSPMQAARLATLFGLTVRWDS